MPTFPHHRNIKKESGTTAAAGAAAIATAANNAEPNLPGMSDLLGTLVKKRRFE